MTIEMKDFWQNHRSDYLPDYHGDVTKDFLRDLASQICVPEGKSIVITSVYRKPSLSSKLLTKIVASRELKLKRLYQGNFSSQPSEDNFNIWFTAENFRPLLDSNFDAFLSYDLDTYMGVNQYLPLWVCRLGPTTLIANETQIAMTRKREISKNRLKNFAVVASNPEQIRSHFIKNLMKHDEVEIFGKLGKAIQNKNDTLREFNFNICFENDIYPGYVTEKAIEAYRSGCIPVWRGDDAGQFINKDAIIDVTNMTITEAIQEVLRISKDPELMIEMKSAPLLKKIIPIEQVVVNLQKSYQEK